MRIEKTEDFSLLGVGHGLLVELIVVKHRLVLYLRGSSIVVKDE